MKKIWYLISILFCLYSINILIKEGDEKVYARVKQIEPVLYLICFNLKNEIKILANRTTVNLFQLNDDVYDHFKNLKYRFYNDGDAEYWNKFNETILSQIKLRNHLIAKDNYCLIKKYQERTEFRFIKSFAKKMEFFAFKNHSYDLFKLKSFLEVVDQLVLIDEENSNCTKDYSKLKCLNDCFKAKHKLSKYIYTAYENETVYLDFEYNETIKKDEHDCLKNDCKREHCKITHFANSLFASNSKEMKSVTSVFEYMRVISRKDFYVQLISLICYFLNIYFYHLFSLLIHLSIKTRKDFRCFLLLLKCLISLIILGCFVHYFILKIENINTQMENPIKNGMKIYLIEPEIFKFIVCVPVANILKSEYENNRMLFNRKLFEGSFSELEKATDSAFNDTVEEIYLQFQNKKIKTNWILTAKVLFMSTLGLARCFEVIINPSEPKYQSQYVTSEIKIVFKHENYFLYLLTEKQSFDTSEPMIFDQDNYMKKIIKRSKSKKKQKCTDYDKEYSNCNSKKIVLLGV